MGDLDKAQRYYSQATEHAPNDPLYWRLLADFSIRYKKDIRDTGLPAARRAVLLNLEDPISLDVMAEVFILLNDPLSAKRFLIRALQANPDYSRAHLHLGFVYVLQGMSAEAWKHLTLAEALAKPGSLTAEQAQRMLDTYFQ
jgi:tetratricopeptide (TPR) repeat protein